MTPASRPATTAVAPSAPLRCRVIGTGPVGLAFCLFALRAGLSPRQLSIDLARINALASGQLPATIRRHLAIAEGSRQLLSRVIAFPPAAPIEEIDVELAGRSGLTRIRAEDFDEVALGHVLTHESLTTTLAAAVARAWSGPGGRAGARPADSEAAVDLDIHAEGAIEDGAGERLAFGQAALLAEVRAPQRPVDLPSTAYERFDRHGPLALLPIGLDGDRFAMVWCDRDETSAERQQWPRERLDEALNQRFASRLGLLAIDGPVDLAPLTRVRRLAGSRLAASPAAGEPARVWIGNAAQMLHPVAGQGLNLGLRDAFELARLLGDLDAAQFEARDRMVQPPALGSALARFDRARQRDRGLLVGVTDSLARGFAATPLHGLQSNLLTALDLLPALRRPLADTLLYGQRR